jgi:Arc/MetJ-type ribon-helix-helix transcriptional regulator
MVEMIRTQIQLTDEQYKALREFARDRRASMAEIIRESVELYLRQSDFQSSEEKRRRALEVCGQFGSGLSDLAEQHDRYVDEAFSK